MCGITAMKTYEWFKEYVKCINIFKENMYQYEIIIIIIISIYISTKKYPKLLKMAPAG